MTALVDHAAPQPYADGAPAYLAAGWEGVLPIGFRGSERPEPRRKKNPPKGYSGDDGGWPERAQVASWVRHHAELNIGLRLPSDIIGIDVDAYVSAETRELKLGDKVLERLEAEHGALPATWRSSSRGAENPSGVRLFRVPVGTRLITAITGGIEIIQRHHRFACCWPSIHPDPDPDTGEIRVYEWYEPSGVLAEHPPEYDDIPDLPFPWIEGLKAEPLAAVADHPPAEPQYSDFWDSKVTKDYDDALAALGVAAAGGRHDLATARACGFCRQEQLGYTGATSALEQFGAAFVNAVKADRADRGRDNGQRIAEAEWASIVETGRAKVRATESTKVVDESPFVGEVEGRSARRLHLTAASSIQPRRVRWCWEGRLALGTLGLLAGPEGLGKSTVSYTIAADVTRGRLRGEYFGTPKVVLVCATEDSWAHTIVPRLMAADADLDLVYRIEVMLSDDIVVGLSLPADLDELERAAIEHGAALLILDPLMSRLDGALDTHKDGDVRRALEPLVSVADNANMSILGLIHHNKSGSLDPLNVVMASKAFTAVARSVHTVLKDPDDETGLRKFFGTPKNNLGRTDLNTLTFTIQGWEYPTIDGPGSTGRLVWGDEICESIADAMARASQDPEQRTAVDEAADWLEDYVKLHGGRVASADAKSSGQRAGHSDSSLKKARKKLQMAVESEGFPRVTYWERASGTSEVKVAPSQHVDPTDPTVSTSEQSGQLGQKSSVGSTGETPRARETQLDPSEGGLDRDLYAPDGTPWCRADGRGGCHNGDRCLNPRHRRSG